jgi:formylglycine-generating enzyme required for sulfatase activity
VDPQEPAPFDERALELQWWEQVKDRNDLAMLAQFMERFADGVFAPLARDRLAELEWTGLKNSRSTEDIQAFVKRWPGSRFEPLAQARLAALRRKSERVDGPSVLKMAGLGAAAVLIIAVIYALTSDWPRRPGASEPQIPIYNPTATERDGKVLVTYSTADRPNETKWIEPGSGESFQDCWKTATNAEACGPEMVMIPAGGFMMGSPDDEEGHQNDEGPRREVTIAQPFAAGKFEVTFAEWDACVSDGGCKHKPEDAWGRGKQPVMRVSWDDITTEYLPWLSRKTGKSYRFLTEAEWEYAAGAGATGRFSFAGGEAELCNYANHADQSTSYSWKNSACSDGIGEKTAPIGSYKPNEWSLHDVHGNVWEWVQDCYADSYQAAPHDGSAAKETSGCARVVRGGSWNYDPQRLRSAIRNRNAPDFRSDVIGFRVARTLSPL